MTGYPQDMTPSPIRSGMRQVQLPARRRAPWLLHPFVSLSRINYKSTTSLVSPASESRYLNPTLLTVSAVMPIAVAFRRAAVFAVCVVISATIAPPAGADPDSDPAPPDAVPQADGRVPSNDPATVKTPDGWTLTLGAKDEMQIPVPPLH